MKVRSITLFTNLDSASAGTKAFFKASREAFHLPVQSVRLATEPFPMWWHSSHFPAVQAKEIDNLGSEMGADYISLGPVLLRHDAGWLDLIPEIIASSDRLFLSAEIADLSGVIDIGRCHSTAEIIRRVSTVRANGFENLFMAALANCRPGTPFFPAAYHGGGPSHFSIALEAADLVQAAVSSASSLKEARENIIEGIEAESRSLSDAAEELASAYGIAFSGIDFTPAPFPVAESSAAGGIEKLGVPRIGSPGSLFAVAFLAEAIDRANFPRCGFSSLMLTVLEDTVLAQRVGEGSLSVAELLSFAAVCGIGLDTVPLPGDVSREVLAGILLDVAALAVRLNKPLSARLMPLPGMSAGDPVKFDFEYFAESRILPTPDEGVDHLLAKLSRMKFMPIRPVRDHSTP